MVQQSELASATSDSHTNSIDKKMASQLESCLSRMTEMYGGLKVQEEPVVRCLADSGCSWTGAYQEILPHCKQCHAEAIWWTGEEEREFKINNIAENSYRVILVVAYGNLFWLHIKNDTHNNHLFAACQQIVMSSPDPHTKFMIRTQLCDEKRVNCISCSTETRPHTEDIAKIFANQHCAARSLHRLSSFIRADNSLAFSACISKMYYFQ